MWTEVGVCKQTRVVFAERCDIICMAQRAKMNDLFLVFGSRVFST